MIDLKGEKTEREIVPEGNHIARLYSIIEIGTVPVAYQEDPSRQVQLTWELPEEMRDFDGEMKPMVVGNAYTASMFKLANLRSIVEGIVGKLTDQEADEFDLHTIQGKTCMLHVVHKLAKNGRTYANIAGTSPLPKAVKEVPEALNPTLYFDYANFDQEVYDRIPQWIKKKMAESREMKERNGFSEKEVNSEDIPF